MKDPQVSEESSKENLPKSNPPVARYIIYALLVILVICISIVVGFYLGTKTTAQKNTTLIKSRVIPTPTSMPGSGILNEDYIQSMIFPPLRGEMFAGYDTAYEMPALQAYANDLFSFQYPADFMLTKQSQQSVTLAKQASGTIPGLATIEITATDFFGAQKVSLNDWFIQTDIRKYFLNQGRITQSFITGYTFTTELAGEKAIFNNFSGYPASLSYGVIATHNNKGYEISITGNVSGAAATFRKIVSSFKFLK